ncbi:hypothetical protein INT43_004415 [Umbelopsis isabellina]|uniref:Hyaluronan synthase n=1 Tax=Mortierella isabellina TaxID=91625 RepID=A0A8H7PI17_MORIS|nr:hypothetical protein INT43_004415 [Umbelopsis isabellina]
MKWSIPPKIVYSICVSLIFVLPALIGYALRIRVFKASYLAIGVYGLVVLIFIVLQLVFATLNRIIAIRFRRKTKQVDSEKTPECYKVGLAVVGYRESPELFSQCLMSIKQLEYPHPLKIVAVIDGDEQEDYEMAHIFEKEFQDSEVTAIPYLLSEATEQQKLDFTELCKSSAQISCYVQPHRGKRHAMYTAFRFLLNSDCEAVMTTDSDTKFDSKAIMELERALHWYGNIGASAGDVRIWNTGNLLSFMASLRYWMAFNIERAAQSFNRCVTCVSGPMGMYKASALEEVLEKWIKQSFLGMECTYGDDRHLTNCVLQKGHQVVYTHLAFCETETPEKFLRWFKQQTRWSKSFYRELLWNAKSIHKHSPWMAAELFYQGLYPFILLFSIFFTLWSRIPLALAAWLISLVAIGSIKTLYALVVSRDFKFLLFPIYSLYYLLGLVPAKLWALVSMWDVGWGTSARSASELKKESQILLKLKEALPVIFWWLLILCGVVFNIIMFTLHPPPLPYDVSSPTTIVFYPNPDQIGAESFST